MNRETDSSFNSQEATFNCIREKYMFMIVSWNATTSLFWWYMNFIPFRYITKYLFNKVFLHVQQALSVYPTKPYLSSPSITPPPLALPYKGTGTPFRTLPHLSSSLLKMFICLAQATEHSGTAFLSLMRQPTWRWAWEDPGWGRSGPAGSHSLRLAQSFCSERSCGLTPPCPVCFLRDDKYLLIC